MFQQSNLFKGDHSGTAQDHFREKGDGSSLEPGATRCQLGKNLKPFSEAAFEVSAGHRRHFHGGNGSCTGISKRRGVTETRVLHYNFYIQIATSLTCTEHPPSLELQLITNRFLPLECVISCAENLLGFFYNIIQHYEQLVKSNRAIPDCKNCKIQDFYGF